MNYRIISTKKIYDIYFFYRILDLVFYSQVKRYGEPKSVHLSHKQPHGHVTCTSAVACLDNQSR